MWWITAVNWPHLIKQHWVSALFPQEPLEFPAHEVRKYFRMGDHVKVIKGQYEGDTGLIVRVQDNMVVLFSDLTMHEVRAVVRWQAWKAHL